MYRRPRIIPCLLIDDQRMVKTVRFDKPRYLGDVINAVRIFNNKGVDELAVLDISATRENRQPDFELLRDVSTEAFMPLSYGGGVKNMEQVHQLFSIGFEKVILNTALIEDEIFVRKAVAYAGSQSIVASIDYRTDAFGTQRCYTNDGKKRTEYTPIALAQRAQSLGVGEVLLNSINADGCMKGYDIKTVRAVADSVSIPLVACGGAGSMEDIKAVLEQGHAHAAAAGSFFVYYGRIKAILITAPTEQEYLKAGVFAED